MEMFQVKEGSYTLRLKMVGSMGTHASSAKGTKCHLVVVVVGWHPCLNAKMSSCRNATNTEMLLMPKYYPCLNVTHTMRSG